MLKSVYKEIETDPEYMYLCCSGCHDRKEAGFPGKKHKQAIKDAEDKYKRRLQVVEGGEQEST